MTALFALLTLSLPSHAVDLREPCEVVRGFQCQYSLMLKDFGPISGRAEMTDHKYFIYEDACEVFQSKLVLHTPHGPQIFATEDDNNANDTEQDRDDDPKARGGWGGKEFYLGLKEDLVILTQATQFQIGKPKRTYKLTGLKPKPGTEGEFEEVARGQMTCDLIP